MQPIEKCDTTFLYQQVVDLITESIDTGALRPGDRLPSLRRMSQTAGVSIPTVRHAYVELERQRRVESRPQSGFYVRSSRANRLVRKTETSAVDPVELCCRSLMKRVYDGINDPELVPLGIAIPTMARPAAKSLHRAMKRVMARTEERSIGYSPTLGEPALRRQIAFHYLDTIGATVNPEHIAITNGGQEALLLALSTVASHGDVIAVETPTYHGLLELIDSLGMLAVEVETCPEEGITISALERTLKTHPVKACMLSTTLGNPLGVTMPDVDRQRLVDLLAEHDVVLIEDDVYGDLRFDGERPIPAQFLASDAVVLTCGSFSKTASPGYRIGWLVSRHFNERIEHLKRSFSCTSGLLQQLTLAEFVATGDYARHLKTLRAELIAEDFPRQTRISKPVGGSVLWLELPKRVNAEQLFDQAIGEGISITPGHIFSPCARYTNFVRLSFGHPWDSRTEDAIRWLGRQVTELTGAARGARRGSPLSRGGSCAETDPASCTVAERRQ